MAHATTPKVHMGTLTGDEGRAIYAVNPVILLPMGSQEDQGPHAPMGDYLLAEKIAELAALQATAMGTPTLVAPVVPFGGADYFGAMIQVATREVHRATGLLIPSLYLWRIGYGLLPGIVGAEKARLVSGHGADPLTSVGLHLFPEYLRSDLIPAAAPLKREPVLDLPYTALGTAEFEGAEVGLPTEYDEVYTKGVAKGDPNLSSAETGAALVDQLVGVCARFAVHLAARSGGAGSDHP